VEKDNLLIELGLKVKKIRKSKGMTQTELAYEVGKDHPSINRLENGKFNPSYIFLLEIAEGLGVHITEIL